MKLARLLVDVTVVTLLTCECSSRGEKSCEALDRKCFHVAAFVPARAGSKGIKDKNLSILGNETLLARTLRIIKECGGELFYFIIAKTPDPGSFQSSEKPKLNPFWLKSFN